LTGRGKKAGESPVYPTQLSAFDYEKAAARLGRLYLSTRLLIQSEHAAKVFGRGSLPFHIENVHWLHLLTALCFKAVGLYRKGYRNFRDIQIRHNEVFFKDLPQLFNGFTLLQLSDLHLDLDESLTEVIIDRIGRLSFDVCVMTGDFRARTHGPDQKALEQLACLRKHIDRPVYAIFGNHDFIEMMEAFAALDITLLLNSSAAIEKGGRKIFLVGVDDPTLYMLENLEKALDGVDTNAIKILLSHSPGLYKKAQRFGFNLMLCGHTHGGQICLPGGIAVIKNDRCPRRMIKGAWRYQHLQGYTSTGTGAVGVPLRFFCPPEITLHHLHRNRR